MFQLTSTVCKVFRTQSLHISYLHLINTVNLSDHIITTLISIVLIKHGTRNTDRNCQTERSWRNTPNQHFYRFCIGTKLLLIFSLWYIIYITKSRRVNKVLNDIACKALAICVNMTVTTDPSLKFHSAPVSYLTTHHFVTEMWRSMHISVTKVSIAAYLPHALRALWEGSCGVLPAVVYL